MKYKVRIDAFEGPLDLLLHLIKENEMEIVDISIAEITDQYIEYIEQMQEFDLDIASEFIVMAAKLLEMKSKTLLPNPKFETEEYESVGEDPRDELVEKLLEYKKYKSAAKYLDRRYDIDRQVHFKRQEDLDEFTKEVPIQELNKDLEVDLLTKAMKNLLKNLGKEDAHRKDYFKRVPKDLYTVDDQIIAIEKRLKKEFKFSFATFLGVDYTKEKIIVTFMALLELLKLNRITVVQDYLFDDIIIESKLEV